MSSLEISSSRDKLVAVEANGLGPCVDGRTADRVLRGPKIQGGVLGVMALGIGRGDEAAVREAVKIIKDAGFMPAVHGDEHHHESGCGFGRLWSEGKLENLPPLKISLARVKEIVLEEGGEYVVLHGDHTEQKVVVNFVKDMTLEPDGSCFILDAWAAAKFGIKPEKLSANATELVKKLNGPEDVETIR